MLYFLINPTTLLYITAISATFFIGLVLFTVRYGIKYKRLLDEKNSYLIAFQKLYTIMASTVTLEETAQKLTNAIAFELGFQAGVLTIIDKQSNSLERIAVSQTPEGIIGLKMFPVPYKSIGIPLTYTGNLLIRAINEKKPFITHNMIDLFVPVLPEVIISNIQKVMKIKTSFVYPIFYHNEVIGAMIFSISGEEHEIPDLQREAIMRIMEVVGTVIERVKVYEKLALTSQSLAIANEKLKELDKIKDDFVSIASHELRTPMTAIRSYAWMALNRSDIPLSAKLKKYLERTLISTERLIHLVNDMLNVSRIESGRIQISPEVFDLQSLIQDVVSEVELKAGEKSISLKVNYTNLPKVFADLEKIHQVLLNLIGNALKFTPKNGNIVLSLMSDGMFIQTTVADNGVGISKDDISKLFQKFGRLDYSYTAAAATGGTGLGLYICKKLIESMGGKIWSTSEGMGKGSQFHFTLPIASKQVINQASVNQTLREDGMMPLEPTAI